MRVSNCWYCARVGKCKSLIPCSNFLRYREYVTIGDIARLCGISYASVSRRLDHDPIVALSWVESVTGFALKIDYTQNHRRVLRLELDNSENAIKLALALEKLKESPNGKKSN